MNMDIDKRAQLLCDIKEIVELLNEKQFNRKEAENIIVKHNLNNEKIAAINSPLNPGYVMFEHSTDDMMKNNLEMILRILKIEYAEELLKLGENKNY